MSKDRPAALAGMVAGDIVMRMGIFPINDIQDYMKALGKFEKGQVIEVEVQRQTDKRLLRVMF